MLAVRLLLGSTLLIAASASAEPIKAIADNGREVILNDNGEWEYVTEDLYATTQDGRRIKLMPNGEWQRVSDEEAPVIPAIAVTKDNRDSINLSELDVSLVLDEVVIEDQRETVGKNTRKRSNIVFYVETEGTEIVPSPNQLKVRDSKGRDYPVISTKREGRLEVRANGAPRWWGVKFFTLEISANTFGNDQAIELRKSMDEVLRKDVSKLPE